MTTRTDVLQIRFTKDGDGNLRASLDKLDNSLIRVDKAGRQAGRGLKQTSEAAQLARRAISAIGVGVLAREFVELTDSMKSMRSQLRIVTKDQEGLNQAFEAVRKIANDTRSDLDATVNLYARISRATKSVGVSQEDILTTTKAVNQAFQISGATAQEAAAATIQFAQGLAAGALRGDEFRSVNEQAPRIMTALADALHLTRGELRQMAFQGKLTTEVIINALKTQSGILQSEFDKVEVTISSSLQVLHNEFTVFISDMDEAAGASGDLAAAIKRLSESLDLLDLATKQDNGFSNFAKTLFDNIKYGLPGTGEVWHQLGELIDSTHDKFVNVSHGVYGAADAARELAAASGGALSPALDKTTDSAQSAAAAAGNLADIYTNSIGIFQKYAEFQSGINDELAVLKAQATGGEKAAEVQKLLNQAKAAGISLTKEHAQAIVEERAAYEDQIKAQQDAIEGARREQEKFAEALVYADEQLSEREKASKDFVGSMDDEIRVLRARAAGGEQAAKVEQLWIQAQKQNLSTSRDTIAAKQAEIAALNDYIDQTRQAAQEWANIWQGAASDVSDGFASAFTTDIVSQKRAKDAAKEQLDQRLQDIQDNLDQGNIKQQDALDERKKAYDEYAKRVKRIDQSIADNLKNTLIDAFAEAIKKMLAMWLNSGLTRLGESLFSGQGFDLSGFGATKAFGLSAGATTSSGAGGAATSGAAVAGGAHTFPAAGTTPPIAPAATLGAGGLATSGLTHAGATEILTSNAAYTGGTTAAGSSGASSAFAGAGLNVAAALAIPLIGGPLIGRLLGGGGQVANFTRPAQQAFNATGGLKTLGPLGLQVGGGGGFGFAAGPNVGFAAQFARTRGVNVGYAGGKGPDSGLDIGGGVRAFQGLDLPQIIKLLADAEKAFESLKKRAADALKETGANVSDVGKAMQDGIITGAEEATLGMRKLQVATTDNKSGAIEYRDITVTEFNKIIAAVESGRLSMEALGNETALSARDIQTLADLGITAVGDMSAAFDDASHRVRSFGSDATGTLGGVANAADSARSAVDGIASSISRLPAVPSVGRGDAAPGPSAGRGDGSFDVGTSFVPRDMYARIHQGEKIIDPQSSRILERYGIKVQGGGASDELLRQVLDRLERIEDALGALGNTVAASGNRVREGVDKAAEETRRRRITSKF